MTVIDIGAQDSKVIHLDAAGPPHQLQDEPQVRGRHRRVPGGDRLPARSAAVASSTAWPSARPRKSTLGSFCTVFAATEILEKIRAGEKVEDIVKGAFRSVVKRVLEMDAIDGTLVMTGGVVAHNPVLAHVGRGVVRPPGARAAGAAVRRGAGRGAVCHGNRPEKESFGMLIQDPPVEVGGGVWMLGTTAYPLYLVRGERRRRDRRRRHRRDGAAAAPAVGGTGDRPRVRAPGRRHARPSGPRDGHSAACGRCFPASRSWPPRRRRQTLGAEKAVAFFRQIDAVLDRRACQGRHDRRRASRRRRWPRTASPSTGSCGKATRSRSRTLAWHVLETPGHSDCSISFHDAGRAACSSSPTPAATTCRPPRPGGRTTSPTTRRTCARSSGWPASRPRCSA